MIARSIFKELKLPIAREKGRLPIFFDFTLGSFPAEFKLPQVIYDVVSQTSDTIDGIILSPQSLPDTGLMGGKEIWVRADWTSALLSTKWGEKEPVVPLINPRYWAQRGISGVVGTLLLGNSSSNEADNIQHLASLRSHSLDIGLPMAIDLHVLKESEDGGSFIEIVELGLNLAVELGSDIMFVPGGDYLVTNQNIAEIAELPVLARQSLNIFSSEDQPLESWRTLLEKIDGIIFTDIHHWKQLIDNPRILQMGMNLLEIQPVGG